MTSGDSFSGHVVPRDPAVIAQVERGLKCDRCRRPYQVWLWPHDLMVVECGCLCACHKDRATVGPRLVKREEKTA